MESRTSTDGTPLVWGCMGGNAPVVRLLLERGANISAKTEVRSMHGKIKIPPVAAAAAVTAAVVVGGIHSFDGADIRRSFAVFVPSSIPRCGVALALWPHASLRGTPTYLVCLSDEGARGRGRGLGHELFNSIMCLG